MRIKLTIAYDGTDFRGFAEQLEVRTVAGELRPLLEKVLQTPLKLAAAGRTDAGVHAWGQVVSLDVPDDAELVAIPRAVNGLLGPEIIIRSVEEVSPDFHARFSAKYRRYLYTIVNTENPDPFKARYAWWVQQLLDVKAMQEAAQYFLGERDFTSFCRQDSEDASTVRNVTKVQWKVLSDNVLRFDISANAFCWQMVRSIVGTLADVGLGKLSPAQIPEILTVKNRNAAGDLAPPNGLCLQEVMY